MTTRLVAELREVFPWADVFRSARDHRIDVQWACGRVLCMFTLDPDTTDGDAAVSYVARQMRASVLHHGPIVATMPGDA